MLAAAAVPRPDTFRFAIIADTHIIDDFYTGPEGSPLDTETIFRTSPHLTTARDAINRLRPAMEQVFLVGDYFHNYPSTDHSFYFKNRTRLDNAKLLTDGFQAPVHIGFGNHDYDVPRVTREFSHDLFREKFKVEPYYSLDYKGFRFLHLNNFLGDTWDPKSATFDRRIGSLGERQLNWAEAQLDERKPTFVFIHFPLPIVRATERADYGLHPMLLKYQDNIQRVISGHNHRWFDLERKYGPRATIMGATRYDEDACMIIEADSKAGTHTWLNESYVDWTTYYSRPYLGLIPGISPHFAPDSRQTRLTFSPWTVQSVQP